MDAAAIASLMSHAKAKILEGSEADGFGVKTFTLYWPDISKEDFNGCVAYLVALKGTTTTTPMAGTRWARSGLTWTYGRVWYDFKDELRQDRFWIYQRFYSGDSSLADVEVENGCAWNVDATYYWRVATIPALPAANTTLGIEYRRGPVVRDDEDGTYTTYIEKRTRLYQMIAEYTARATASETVKVTDHLGLKEGDKDDAGAVKAVPVLAAGKVVDVARTKNPECTQNRRDTVTEAKAQSLTQQSEARADQTTQRLWEHHAVAKQEATAVPGKIVRATSTENEFQRFDSVKETITPQDQTATDGEARADQTSATEKHTQNDAPETATPVAGKIVRATNRSTPFGKVETAKETVTPTPQVTTHAALSSASADAQRVWERHADAKVDAAGGGSGTIVRATSQENEFGKFENVKTTETPKKQTFDVTYQTEGGPARYRRVLEGTVVEAAAEAAALVATKKNDMSGGPTQAGNADWTITQHNTRAGDGTFYANYDYVVNGHWEGQAATFHIYVIYTVSATAAKLHLTTLDASKPSGKIVDGCRAAETKREDLGHWGFYRATRVEWVP